MRHRQTQTTYRRHLSPGWNLVWSLFAFALLVLLFIVINWLGIVLTFLLLALVLGIVLGIKYGWFNSALRALAEPSAQQPRKAQESFGLPAQSQPHSEEYGQGYQAQTSEAQPKWEYEQPPVPYPEQELPPLQH